MSPELLLVSVACSVLVALLLGVWVLVLWPDVVAVALLVLSSPPPGCEGEERYRERES
jgi:hypothetical protein